MKVEKEKEAQRLKKNADENKSTKERIVPCEDNHTFVSILSSLNYQFFAIERIGIIKNLMILIITFTHFYYAGIYYYIYRVQ